MNKLMSRIWCMLKLKLRGSKLVYVEALNFREEVRAGVENQELTQKCLTPTPSDIYIDTPHCFHKLKLFGFGTIISVDFWVSWGFRRSSNATCRLLLILELGLLC